jgi:transporter family protein
MQTNIIVLLVITAVLWGITPIMEKKGLQTASPLVGLVFRNFTVSFILLMMILFMGKAKEVLTTSPKAVILFGLSGIIAGLLAMLTYFSALKLGATSQIVPIAATYPLVAAIISVLVLGEQVTFIRIIGTILIIIGIWLVKIN